MALLSIDQEKCKQDGLCAADCPMSIIRFDGPGHYPVLIQGGEAFCVRCGHCVAACPHGENPIFCVYCHLECVD